MPTQVDPDRVRKLLVVRRDNIGDLLLTTPLLATLRVRFPGASITVLANDYSAPVLAGNPHVDRIVAYTKAKHADDARIVSWAREARVLWGLRGERFDLAIHANPTPSLRTARLLRTLRIALRVGVVADADPPASFTHPLRQSDLRGVHHVERTHALLSAIGIDDAPGPLVLRAPALGAAEREARWPAAGRLRVAIHLSSRKPCNRWPLERYASLVEACVDAGRSVGLCWSPGAADDPRHPGDDADAERVCARFGEAIVPLRTGALADLIAAVSMADVMVCPDGGAMHIASALGKPLVALFGCTSAAEWGPWQVPHLILDGGGSAAAISVDAVTAALTRVSS